MEDGCSKKPSGRSICLSILIVPGKGNGLLDCHGPAGGLGGLQGGLVELLRQALQEVFYLKALMRRQGRSGSAASL
jgi:hypothetical protein